MCSQAQFSANQQTQAFISNHRHNILDSCGMMCTQLYVYALYTYFYTFRPTLETKSVLVAVEKVGDRAQEGISRRT